MCKFREPLFKLSTLAHCRRGKSAPAANAWLGQARKQPKLSEERVGALGARMHQRVTMTPTDGHTRQVVRSMPVCITQVKKVLLHAGGAELSLTVDRSLSAGNTGNPREVEAWSSTLHSLAYPQERSVSGERCVCTDQFVKIARCVTGQPGSKHLNLLRQHAYVERVRAKQVAEGLSRGSIA
ncbi:hypothetical protein D3C78_944080 [compost metagenome]